ncbi:MAG: SOS response-associated peptidase [Ferrovibrio sp.]|nr:SOS response-associated peptidase [Ferrovibrio sp.]
MCGRFALTVTMEVLAQMLPVPERPNLPPRWNIAPTQSTLVVIRQADSNHLCMMRWGFAGPNNAPLINARAETAASKPSFRAAFAGRRCLVPADSFYEWQPLADGRKQPWRVGLRDGAPFCMAGLWEEAVDKDGVPEPRFTILTIQANAYLAPLHERMPVILAPEQYARWLQEDDTAQDLLRPYPAEAMARYRVSDVVNAVKNDGPACFARLSQVG